MLCLTAWHYVQIGVVAGGCCRLYGRVLFLLRQFLETVKDLLSDQVPLLYPAFDTGRGPDARKTLLAVEHIHAVTILRNANLVVDLRQLIAQRDLRSGDIVGLEHTLVAASAARQERR